MNKYDRIIKENFFTDLLPVIEFLLGLPTIKATTPIPGKLQHTLEREPDYVRIVELENGVKFILHIEFQTHNEPGMIYRMRHYHDLLSAKFPKLRIRPFVVYLGEKKPTMRTELRNNEIFTHFELRNLKDYSAQELSQKDIPEALVLAVLADYQGEKPEKVISTIIKKLKKISGDETKLKRYITQLAGLSGLRNLEKDVLKQFKKMALDFEIEESYFFQEGLQEGIQEGIQEGRQKQKREMIQNALQRSNMSVREIAQLLGVSEKLVREIKKETL